MNFNEGDIVTIDETVFKVNSVEPDGYWLQEDSNGSYYYLRYLGNKEGKELLNAGRLSYGRKKELYNDERNCYHDWKRYVGMTEVYDYCKCGAKKFPHWTEIGDGKKDD